MYVSSVSSTFFLYIESECFKSKLGIAYGMRLGSGRGREQSLSGRAARATFSGAASAWPHESRHGQATSSRRGPIRGPAKTDCSCGCPSRRPDATGAVYTINLSMAYGQAAMLLSLGVKGQKRSAARFNRYVTFSKLSSFAFAWLGA